MLVMAVLVFMVIILMVQAVSLSIMNYLYFMETHIQTQIEGKFVNGLVIMLIGMFGAME
jgi:hypothetical protein